MVLVGKVQSVIATRILPVVVVVFVGKRSVFVLPTFRVFDVIYVRTIRSDRFVSTTDSSVLVKMR